MLALLVLAGLMLAAWRTLDAGQWVRPERLREELAGLGAWGPVALMGVMALAAVIGPVPTLPVSVTAGIAFGFLPGSVYAVTGGLAGAAVVLLALAGLPWLIERFDPLGLRRLLPHFDD